MAEKMNQIRRQVKRSLACPHKNKPDTADLNGENIEHPTFNIGHPSSCRPGVSRVHWLLVVRCSMLNVFLIPSPADARAEKTGDLRMEILTLT
jgi:hypothetical protein